MQKENQKPRHKSRPLAFARAHGLHVMALSAAIVLGLAAEAGAQDRWSGMYGGLSFGAGGEVAEIGRDGVDRHKRDTTKLGAYAGFNRVREGSGFVWGAEAQLSALGSDKTETTAKYGTTKFHKGFLLDTRLRAGFATDQSFFYGIAGLSTTNAKVVPQGNTDSMINVGLSLGVGAEFALNDVWSTRVDATATGLGGYDETFNGSKREVGFGVGQISVGLTRKF